MARSVSYRFTRRQYRDAVIIIVLVALSVWERSHIKPHTAAPIARLPDAAFQYRTIPVSDSSTDLIAYEFHSQPGDYRTDCKCSAIIRHMDPSKDAYKQYCRAVIADIIRSLGTEDISVTVYDNYQAYVLGEITINDYRGLSKEETDTVYRHVVATYRTEQPQWSDTIRYMGYYTYAGNHYTEQVAYEQ